MSATAARRTCPPCRDELRAGNPAQVAQGIIDLLPVTFVLESFEARDRHMHALSQSLDDPEIPAPLRLLALIEGLGTNGAWRQAAAAGTGLVARILDRETEARLDAAEKDLRRGRLPGDERDQARHLRHLLMARAVRLRIQAAVPDRRPEDVEAMLARARQLARQAQHESMQMSIQLDACRHAMARGRLDQAQHLVDHTIQLASRQGNDRRLAMALIERARIHGHLGLATAAWADHAQATQAFERLQTDLRGRPLPDWYQPGFRRELSRTAADVHALVGPRPDPGLWNLDDF